MRLKRLELSGFKSFVDPTRIDFGRGITSVVGPNGSGKSNIVDAIRWVLGEHSARHLRGGVMDDLIFQGSDTRSPVAICDVELIFEVEKGLLSPPYHELDEIRVRRRLTRDGGSDAFINGKSVRLKDIVDIFLDTGISTRAYAIIEQGSIARMITAKPEERRLLLEEAAGVMKYRARRRETELKMNSTRQNLERVADLLEEVRSQCRSLRQQASRAERFRTMQNTCEQLQKQSMGYTYRQRQQQLAMEEEKLQTAASLLQQTRSVHAARERALAEARATVQQHDEQVQQAQDQLRQAELLRSQLQQQAERVSGEKRLLQERINTLEQRLQEAAARSRVLAADIAELEKKEAARHNDDLLTDRQMAAEAYEETQAHLLSMRQQRDSLLAEFEQLRGALQSIESRKQQALEMVDRLQHRLYKVDAELVDIREQVLQYQTQVQSGEERLEMAEHALVEAETTLLQSHEQHEQARADRLQGMQRRDESERSMRAARGNVDELRAKLEQQQGLSHECRRQLSELGGVWVDESLEVPAGLELAVAAVLRGIEADVLMPLHEHEFSSELLASLKEKPLALRVKMNKTQQELFMGNLTDAMGLNDTHPLYPMFAHASLVEDVQALCVPQSGCIVSRDGWYLDSQAWLVPPSRKHTVRRLEMKRQLKQFEQDFARHSATWQEAEAMLQHIELAEQQARQQWQQQQLKVTEAKSMLQAAQMQSKQALSTLTSLQSREQHLQQEHMSIHADMAHWHGQQSNVADADIQRLAEAEQRLQMQTTATQVAEEQTQQARIKLSHAEQAWALHQQAVEAVQRDLQRLRHEYRQWMERDQHDAKLLLEVQKQLTETSKYDELDMQLAAAIERVERTHQELSALQAQGHACLQHLHSCEQQEREARKQIEQVQQSKQQAELQCVERRTRLQDLAEEIWQKLQLEPETLIDDSVSDADAAQWSRQLQEVEMQLARFGPVNLLAIDEFEQASQREGFLAEQSADLESSLTTMDETIRRIDATTRKRFMDIFEQTNGFFKKTFPRLFGGGRAELRLDGDDVLTAGVEGIVQPPGKRLQEVTLLSGGEKALTAVALVFSIFCIKPAPFCILDEVDAPLDDANVERFVDMISELAGEVQFLAITHNKITMQKADRLIGVSMPEAGVSAIVGVDMQAMTAA
ncbi:MAG: chromosome segregation protein SMC [Zetaproteobacteria bacterium CG02_land_8_20_14_3_00_50_9]|nr:MAG: chromosome segregation protein SMC [Zetaproteobacteria bacterium CG02_land_8_20_14_3_00_50_9]